MQFVPIITGLGLATPLGCDAQQTWSALLAGRYIHDHATVPLESAAELPRVFHLAQRVAGEATAHAGWHSQEISQAALIVATSKGSIASWRSALPGLCGLSDVADFLSRELRLGFTPRLTLSAACASGLHGLIRTVMMIRSGEINRAIVVAVESSVQDLFIGSFNRLGVLSQRRRCRPFDVQRDGFLMSEAAAAVCVQGVGSDDVAGFVRNRPFALAIDRFALGGDAHHVTASDPDAKLLRNLLSRVIGDRAVDLIHAHGTGTEMNDQIELAAIEASLTGTDSLPSLFSHKAALGHSQGAAGLVSVVLNGLAHGDQIVPPNILSNEPLPANRVMIAAAPVSHRSAAASPFPAVSAGHVRLSASCGRKTQRDVELNITWIIGR